MAVGGITEGIVDVSADLAALGLNPLVFLHTKESIERSFLTEVRDKLIARRATLDHNLAVAIATEVSKLIK